MTISEQLQFSVLTAPVAAVDRRTLSQAWYSALYGGGSRAAAAASAPVKGTQLAAPTASRSAVRAESREPARAFTVPGRAPLTPGHAEGVLQDRRAPRSPLARKIERAFLHPRSSSRKASITIEGEHGRVHVVLRSQGSQVKLIAICPPKARPHVAAALAQARYALAVRGIELDADTRTTGPC